jgi:uncharacterized protein YcfJ
MMKIILAVTCLLFSASALADTHALVVGIDPIYREEVRYQAINISENICYQNQMGRGDGWIERGSNCVFGSTAGLIGTAVGVAIGSEIGGGRGRDAAKIVGGIVGNSVGNNVARNNQGTRCETVTRVQNTPYTEMVVSNYRVHVELNGGRYTAIRSSQPIVGTYIPVSLNVN